MTAQRRWSLVVTYAVAMAFGEAAVVVYLRSLFNRLDPAAAPSLDVPGWVIAMEVAREAATLMMLVAVGGLAGRTWRGRLGYLLVAFGTWDICYYVFLVPLSGWPRSLFDWDVLFLIPLPWWGPVLAPVSIAGLMLVGGTLMTRGDELPGARWPTGLAWSLMLIGLLLALYVFTADSIRALGGGSAAIRQVRPTWFNWPLFALALALMTAPIAQAWRVNRRGLSSGRRTS